MGTVTRLNRTYFDFPVSALRFAAGMTVHAVDLDDPRGERMITGELVSITPSEFRTGIVFLTVLLPDVSTDLATVRADDCVSVTESVTLCSEHGLSACDCDTAAAEAAVQDGAWSCGNPESCGACNPRYDR